MAKKDKLTERWSRFAAERLEGRTIVQLRYMTDDEAEALGWYHRPLVIQFDDGSLVWPSRDDEGNDAGALFGQGPDGRAVTYPVLSKGDS